MCCPKFPLGPWQVAAVVDVPFCDAEWLSVVGCPPEEHGISWEAPSTSELGGIAMGSSWRILKTSQDPVWQMMESYNMALYGIASCYGVLW